MDSQFSNTLLYRFSARRTWQQKQAFLSFAARQFHTYYPAMPQDTELFFGDPQTAKAILVARYDTPARKFFPYVHFANHRLLNYIQYMLPLSFLLAACLLLYRMLHWSWFPAVCLFLPLCFTCCTAFINPVNHNASSALIALHALGKSMPDVCIVLAGSRRGVRRLQRRYPHTPVLLLDRIGYGDIPILQYSSSAAQCFDIPDTVAAVRIHTKACVLKLSMGVRRSLGYSTGPSGTPADNTVSAAGIEQAITLVQKLISSL